MRNLIRSIVAMGLLLCGLSQSWAQVTGTNQIGASSATTRTNGVWGRGRVALVGDSLLANAYAGCNAPQNTTGGVVVSGTTVTVLVPSNVNCITGPGQMIQIFNAQDVNFAIPFNGATVPVLSVPDATHFTISACYNGACLSPTGGIGGTGDYSGITNNVPVSGGNGWLYKTANVSQDASWFRWLNYFNSNPLTVVADYAIGGTGAAVGVSLIPKIQAGPIFDLGIIQYCTNDIDNNASTAALAVAAAQSCVANDILVSNAMLAMGARVLIGIPPPVASGFGATAQASNIGFNQARYLLLTYAYKTPNVFTYDLFKNVVDTSGNMNANYTSSTAAFVHPLPAGLIPTAKNESTRLAPILQNTNFTLTSALDDSTAFGAAGITYPNLIKNGYMTGTNASPGGSWVGWSGTMPTNWSFLNNTGTPTVVTAGAVTRVAGTNQNTNAVAWGFEETVNITWTAASQGFTQWSNAGDTTTLNSLVSAAASGSGIYVVAGFTVRGTNTCANLKNITGTVFTAQTGGVLTPGATFNAFNDNGDTWPLLTGDVVEIRSDPIWFPVGTTITSLGLENNIYGGLATSGSCNLAFSSEYIRPVANPYL